MATQGLSSERTPLQRFFQRIQTKQPGQLPLVAKVLLYLLLAVLVLIDYAVLNQAFVLLQQALSRSGTSVGASTAYVVLLVSFAAVALPHIAAWALQRRSMNLLSPVLRWVPWAAIAMWALLVGMVTYIRIVAAGTPLTAKADNTADGSAPTTTGAEAAPTIDRTQLILAFVMLLVLLISAMVAFVIAVVTHNPLHTAVRQSRARLAQFERVSKDRAAEVMAAKDTEAVVEQATARDTLRFDSATVQVNSMAEGLRAEIRTVLAASLGSPDATSHLIRELRRRYSTNRGAQPPASDTPQDGAPA